MATGNQEKYRSTTMSISPTIDNDRLGGCCKKRRTAHSTQAVQVRHQVTQWTKAITPPKLETICPFLPSFVG